jgi:predicted dehydrogenase
MDRRQFLKRSAFTAAAAALGAASGCTSNEYRGRRGAQLGLAPTSRPIGANDDIRVAVVGFNNHGKSHIRAYRRMPGVRIVALCDCDERVLNTAADGLAKDGVRVERYRDIRRLLENKEVDAISCAMTNRWHTLAGVWACQAGKDVCVEKPVSHCIWEGRKLVEAARKYDRVVQADLDNRTRPALDQAFGYVRGGAIGKVVHVRAYDYKRRVSMGKVSGPQKIPNEIDYDLWCGPAPLLPLMRQKFHYDWHWQWAHGSGEIANNGSHHLDMVRWALGKAHLPRTALSFGGRYGYADDGQTPNTQVAVYDFGDGVPVVYEARGLPRGAAETRATSRPTTSPAAEMDDVVGVLANGKPLRVVNDRRASAMGGVILVCEGGYSVGVKVYDNDAKLIRDFDDNAGDSTDTSRMRPQEHFIRAVRSRRSEDAKTDILQGHLSAGFCHMGNVSLQCGEPMSFASAADVTEVRANAHARAALERMVTHLQANGVDTKAARVTMGPTLTMDSSSERFVGQGSERANWFIKDSYRDPFVVPERV